MVKETTMHTERMVLGDHFLSATNPLATADQRDCERRAQALMAGPADRAWFES
jgi:hypothetical protein